MFISVLLRARLPSWLTLSRIGGIDSLFDAAQFQLGSHNEDKVDVDVTAEGRNPNEDEQSVLVNDRQQANGMNANSNEVDDIFDMENTNHEIVSEKLPTRESSAHIAATNTILSSATETDMKTSNMVIVKSLDRKTTMKEPERANNVEATSEDGVDSSSKKGIVRSKDVLGKRNLVEESSAMMLMMSLPCPVSCVHFRPGDKTSYLLGTLAGHVLLVSFQVLKYIYQ